MKPDSDARRAARFKNSYLRLLLNLCGCQLFGPASEETPESLWVFPEDVTADSLKDALHFINQAEFNPPTFDDGQLAENQLKRKTQPRKKADFDDDEGDDLDDEFLFEPGGPTARKAVDERPKKTRKRRRRNSQAQPLDDEELEEKARKRREREREKARRIKSAVYVREGDDEFDEDEDEAFFAREREIAARAARAAQSALEPGLVEAAEQKKKRKPAAVRLDSDEDDDILGLLSDDEVESRDDTPMVEDDDESESRKKMRVSVEDEADDDDDDDADVDMEDASSPGNTQQSESNTKEDADDDDAVMVTRRPRVRGGFVIDSDDED